MICSACGLVSARRERNTRRSGEFMIGLNTAAGRSWRVKIGERMEYGGNRSWRAIALVTVNDSVGAQRPRIDSYAFEIRTKGCEAPRVPASIVQP
jgi:hypothetical protein